MSHCTTRVPTPALGHDAPAACVSLQDAACRSRIIAALEALGWTVTLQPTGFHVLQAIAGMIEGDPAWRAPALIVIDARSPGCAGTTIAAGLRELGIAIPIVLVGAAGESLPVAGDPTIEVVEHARAERAVARLARGAPGAPAPRRAPERRAQRAVHDPVHDLMHDPIYGPVHDPARHTELRTGTPR